MCEFPKVNQQIYLHIRPSFGFKLVKARGRLGEVNYLTQDYLKQLHDIQMCLFNNVYTCTNSITHMYDTINIQLQLTNEQIDKLPHIHDIRTDHINLKDIQY